MDIRARLEVFGDTDELCKLLYNRTRTSPDELLMECRDSLLGMFDDLHNAADEIERLRKLCEQQHKALEGMSYYSQPRKTDPMELIGFECRQGDKKFDVAAKAIAAYEEMNRE